MRVATRSKYGNRRTTVAGKTFASKKEAERYVTLTLWEKAGAIHSLVCQPRYELVVNGVKICTYVADFAYWQGDAQVTEDVKGMKTQVYKLKKKLLKACHGIEVQEV